VNKLVVATVKAHEEGMRLDRWLADRVAPLGRKRAKHWCASGKVAVNGQRADKNLRLHPGMEIQYYEPDELEAVQNPALRLDVRLENSQIVIVCKPAGQPTAALDERDDSSLANALLARYPEMRGVGGHPLEAGLVHRLDNGTSGLLLAARNSAAFATLREALRHGSIKKTYWAIVCDTELPDAGTLDWPLRPSPRNSRRMVVAEPEQRGARAAETRYKVVERRPGLALVEAQASPALRHQLRAHFAARGCPLVNDELYGSKRFAELAPNRHALHASRIEWSGNEVVPAVRCFAQWSDDLADLLRCHGFSSVSAL
jgi:23S rRNA pseudouridine1911/1915/1917 synthase